MGGAAELSAKLILITPCRPDAARIVLMGSLLRGRRDAVVRCLRDLQHTLDGQFRFPQAGQPADPSEAPVKVVCRNRVGGFVGANDLVHRTGQLQ